MLDARSYKIIYANKFARDLGQGPLTTCYALTHHRIMPCDGTNHPCPLQVIKRTKKPYVVEHIHFDADGNKVYVEIHGAPILNENGEVIQMIEYSIDISCRKKVEATLVKTTKMYEHFVPKDFLKYLGQNDIVDVKLGLNVQKEMSILFSDIRSFTTLAEKMNNKDTFKFINSYMKEMGPLIRKHKGFIDKYIGDTIMAIFDSSPDDAIRSAINMIDHLKEYNNGRARAGYDPVEIGIHTGPVTLGIIGEHHRMEETVIGDSVNLSSRIEGLTKKYGSSILISQNTVSILNNEDEFLIRLIDWVNVKGKDNAMPIYEVFDADPRELREAKIKTLNLFCEAIALFQLNKLESALSLFQECVNIAPADNAAKFYVKRCQDCLEREEHQVQDLLEERKWSDQYSVDNEEVDAQHKELFRRVNILVRAIHKAANKNEAVDRSEVVKVVVFLKDYVIIHFKTEELVMEKYNYPELEYHRKIHSRFVNNFSKIAEELLAIVDNPNYLMIRFQILVTDWLVNHIVTQDMRYRDFINELKNE